MQQPSTYSGVASGGVRKSTRPDTPLLKKKERKKERKKRAIPAVYCMCRYLSGVLDFTEELSRHAIQRATVRDTPAVQRCRDIVDAIMGQFMQVGVAWRCGAKVWDRCGAVAIMRQILQAWGKEHPVLLAYKCEPAMCPPYNGTPLCISK